MADARATFRRVAPAPRGRGAAPSGLVRLAAPVCAALGGVALLAAAPSCTPSRTADTASTNAQAVAEYDLARDAFQNGKPRVALDHIERSLAHDEDNAEASYLGALILLSFCALDQKSTDCRLVDAEKYARAALDSNPDLRDAKNALGVILVHQRRFDDAIAILEPLANDILYGSPEKSWGNLGWAYLERGSVDEAIDALRRAVAAQPLFCVGQYRLGLAFEKRGELGVACEAYTKALDTARPECQALQDAFEARSRCRAKLGQTEEAHADLLRCRDLARSTPVGQRCEARLQTYQ